MLNSRLFAKIAVGASLLSGLATTSAHAVPTLAAPFASSYTLSSLGTPTGVPPLLGGLTFLDSDTLLIGGNANGAAGNIWALDVTRDGGGHINGFSGSATLFSTAPYIDGGLDFGPGGVLFYTGFPTHELGQIKPGSTTPDRIDAVPSIGGSVGALVFIPPGFAGAGELRIVSYNSGEWAEVTLTADGLGTFDFTVSAPVVTLGGGPEGVVYVKGTNDEFGVDSILLAEYAAGNIAAYDIDGNGNPIAGTRRDFITGLTGAEGAVIDPLTGDFLFSTFGGGDQIVIVQGFDPPPVDGVPAPGAIALFGLGLLGLGALRRKLS
jgi:hypothetical protein